jgi:uncharacterized protein YdeI (YjbR/CyaY-like superfamily)
MGIANPPRFFRTPSEWRKWLVKNHASATEQVIGFHKAGSAEKGITYREALDEALCFGWIDAVRRGGTTTWSIRFTPRKPKSIWSAVNQRRIEELKDAGRIQPAGLAAYEGRDRTRQKKYSFENRDTTFDAATGKEFRASKSAWVNFNRMPPSYRLAATWWIMSAKRPDTKARRLQQLMADSAAGIRVKHLRRSGGA